MPEVFDLNCGECGALMKLRESRYGPFYGCTNFPQCEGSHGAHPDGSPMGIPADKETKEARQRAHAVFDLLWHPKDAPYPRGAAYFEMRTMMGLSEEDAHIGRFDKEQCETMIQKVNKRLARLKGETA